MDLWHSDDGESAVFERARRNAVRMHMQAACTFADGASGLQMVANTRVPRKSAQSVRLPDQHRAYQPVDELSDNTRPPRNCVSEYNRRARLHQGIGFTGVDGNSTDNIRIRGC